MKKAGPIRRFFRSTSWVVWLTAIVTAVVMFLQKFMVGQPIAAGEVEAVTQAAQYMGEGMVMVQQSAQAIILPHQTLAWVFAAIASGYAGTDRIAQFVKTSSLEYGEADLGDPKKLRWVIFISLALLAEAVVLTVFFGVPGLALDALVTAFGGSGLSFVIGNKAIKAASATSGSHKYDEGTRFHSEEDIVNEPTGTGK